MSATHAPPSRRPARSAGGRQPSDRRRAAAIAGTVAACAIALAISVAVPAPRFVLVLALIVALVLVVALIFWVNLETGVTILAVYLGTMDGPVKLLSHNQFASAGRDVLIAAVSIGAILRIIAKRERVKLPPLTGWVIAFSALVLIEAANPKTHGLLKTIGGYRQQLEWIPFFFFGYALMRSKRRFAQMFVILGVIALANGIVATYQTQIPVAQLAAWGPGYNEEVNGNTSGEGLVQVTGRKYVVEGEGHVRPMGLADDSGGGAGIGVIALPGCLALLAFGGRRRKIYASILTLGSLVAIFIGLGRLQVVGSVVAIGAFALLSASAGRKVTKPLAALLTIAAIAVPFGALFVSAVGANLFSRYESIEPNRVVETSTEYKEGALELLPHYISVDPFGFGLGCCGPASGFGGSKGGELEGHGVTAETQYNFAEDETGAPGLILWIALSIEILVLIIRWLPKVPNVDIRIALAGVFAVFIAHIVMGFRGAFMDTSAAGAYFWYSFGIAAYWFAGPGRPQIVRRRKRRGQLNEAPA
ncbi:MAG TPA: hypothetical protein VMA83_07100 [Solirubrobacteraceae bacterium]|nr:hypothetical protein [Solirubrobacteraceae bacterium]